MKRLLVIFAFVAAARGGSISIGAQSASCAPSGGLAFICGVPNPKTSWSFPNTRWLIASGMAPGSGLHLVDTRAKTARNLYAAGAAKTRADRTKFASCPGPLDPEKAVLHGLSLRPAQNGLYTVYATNHGGRQSIEVFELDSRGAAPSATWVGCVLMPSGLEANSVAAFRTARCSRRCSSCPARHSKMPSPAAPPAPSSCGRPAPPRSRRCPAPSLPANNGIETSPDDREFFVVSTTTKRIVAFSRSNPGKPLRVAQLAEFGPDNVRWTSDNRLITAGMIDNEPACGGAPKTEEGIRCARGYVAATIDPKTMAVNELARGPATPSFTGTAIAMPVGDELWLGSFNADRLAYRPLK